MPITPTAAIKKILADTSGQRNRAQVIESFKLGMMKGADKWAVPMIRRNIRSKFPKSKHGPGGLLRSTGWRVRVTETGPELTLFNRARYAAAQEYPSTTIRPIVPKNLAIPLDDNPTSEARGFSPRHIPGLRYIQFMRGGELKKFLVRGKGAAIKFMFVLKKQVVLRGRNWFRPVVKQAHKKLAGWAFKQYVKDTGWGGGGKR